MSQGEKPVKNFLKKIREEKNMTQERLAEASGVTRYIISDFENGKRRPSPRTISRLAEALDCTYIDLISGVEKADDLEKKNLGQNRQQYLLEAISLTKEHCGGKGFGEEMMMKISGSLSHLIEEYETSSNQAKIEMIKKAEEQKAQLLANNIFLQTRVTTHEN